MKILYTITTLIFTINIYSQSFQETIEDNETIFQYVVEYDSTMSKNKIFDMMNINMMKTYRGTLIPSDIKDEGDGRIFATCKGEKLIYYNTIKMDGGYFNYNLTIICKDSKAKLVVNNIHYNRGEMVQMRSGTNFSSEEPDNWTKSALWNKQSRKEWARMKDQFRSELNQILPKLIKKNNVLSDDF